jgi:hypothetical protein
LFAAALNLVKTAATLVGKKRVQTGSVSLPADGQKRFKQKWLTAGTGHVKTSDAGSSLASGKVEFKSETPSRSLGIGFVGYWLAIKMSGQLGHWLSPRSSSTHRRRCCIKRQQKQHAKASMVTEPVRLWPRLLVLPYSKRSPESSPNRASFDARKTLVSALDFRRRQGRKRATVAFQIRPDAEGVRRFPQQWIARLCQSPSCIFSR